MSRTRTPKPIEMPTVPALVRKLRKELREMMALIEIDRRKDARAQGQHEALLHMETVLHNLLPASLHWRTRSGPGVSASSGRRRSRPVPR